jgi:hypothetical protein
MPATLEEVQKIVQDEFPGSEVGGIREEDHRILGTIVWKGFKGQDISERSHLITAKVRDRLGLKGLNVGVLFPLAPGEKL